MNITAGFVLVLLLSLGSCPREVLAGELMGGLSTGTSGSLGLETRFAISDKTSFQLQLGVDYYQEVELAGHDTIYTPDGDHVNPRDGYNYSDADEAVDQPSVEILGMMGLLVGF